MAGRRRDPYAILGVTRGATRAEIARAYHAFAKRAHPDLGGPTPAVMQDLNWAWHLLSDPKRRADWDRLHAGAAATHWGSDARARTGPEIEPRYEGWTGQPAWTVSGEPWAGAGQPAADSRRGGFGCIGVLVLVLVIAVIVLISGLYPHLVRPFDFGTDAAPLQSTAP